MGAGTLFRALAPATIALFVLVSCGYGERLPYHVLNGPLNAIDLTFAGGDIVVLAGTSEAKSISVFANSTFGQELLRFPVSEYATSIRGSGGDSFLLGIGAAAPGLRGAVEYWNVRGQMIATVPMPSAVIGLSKVDRGIAYALVADAEKRAAVPVDVAASSALGHVVPLPAGVTALDQCLLLQKPYLVTVGPSNQVLFVNALTNTVTTSSIDLSGVSCIGTDVLIGIRRELFSRSVQIVRLSKDDEHSEFLRAPADAVEVVPDSDGRVLILRRMGADSDIQIWTREELANIFALPPPAHPMPRSTLLAANSFALHEPRVADPAPSRRQPRCWRSPHQNAYGARSNHLLCIRMRNHQMHPHTATPLRRRAARPRLIRT